MTQELAALSALVSIGAGDDELNDFQRRWHEDRLVMDKWFSLQAGLAEPEDASATAKRLAAHDAFDWRNPNRFRALFSSLAGNTAGFHNPDGSAYRLLADWLIKLDAANPQTAARVSTAFDTWKRYDEDRQAMIRTELERMLATDGLSRDMTEMVTRMLGV